MTALSDRDGSVLCRAAAVMQALAVCAIAGCQSIALPVRVPALLVPRSSALSAPEANSTTLEPVRVEYLRETRAPIDPEVVRAQGEPAAREDTPLFSAPASEAPRATQNRRGLFGLPPLSELLDDTPGAPDDETTYFPEERGQFAQPDIRAPGPDTANFPNSPYTLPQGRLYIETSPLFLSGPSAGTPATQNMEFLLRYGLTDRFELRLFGNGPTWQWGRPGTVNGFAPLAWDMKVNLWRENQKYWIPAAGFEAALLTPSGTPGLNQGYQPIMNLLFDWSLPADFMLEANVGFAGDPSPNNAFSSVMEPTVQWSLQRELFKDFDVFFQGYFNGSAVPRFGDGIVLGGGAVWAVTRRLAIYGSYNAGITSDAPTTIAQLGAALAF